MGSHFRETLKGKTLAIEIACLELETIENLKYQMQDLDMTPMTSNDSCLHENYLLNAVIIITLKKINSASSSQAQRRKGTP